MFVDVETYSAADVRTLPFSGFTSDSVAISCQACVAPISIRFPIVPASCSIMAPTAPVAGNIMSFRYPDENLHRFWNDFPSGRRMRAFQAYVDLQGTIEVLDVRIAEKDGVEYTAVQFRSHNGTFLWTTFCKDDLELLDFITVV